MFDYVLINGPNRPHFYVGNCDGYLAKDFSLAFDCSQYILEGKDFRLIALSSTEINQNQKILIKKSFHTTGLFRP